MSGGYTWLPSMTTKTTRALEYRNQHGKLEIIRIQTPLCDTKTQRTALCLFFDIFNIQSPMNALCDCHFFYSSFTISATTVGMEFMSHFTSLLSTRLRCEWQRSCYYSLHSSTNNGTHRRIHTHKHTNECVLWELLATIKW